MEVKEAWKTKVAEKRDIKFADAVILIEMTPPFREIGYSHIRQLVSKCGLYMAKSGEELIEDLVTITNGFDNP